MKNHRQSHFSLITNVIFHGFSLEIFFKALHYQHNVETSCIIVIKYRKLKWSLRCLDLSCLGFAGFSSFQIFVWDPSSSCDVMASSKLTHPPAKNSNFPGSIQMKLRSGTFVNNPAFLSNPLSFTSLSCCLLFPNTTARHTWSLTCLTVTWAISEKVTNIQKKIKRNVLVDKRQPSTA